MEWVHCQLGFWINHTLSYREKKIKHDNALLDVNAT